MDPTQRLKKRVDTASRLRQFTAAATLQAGLDLSDFGYRLHEAARRARSA